MRLSASSIVAAATLILAISFSAPAAALPTQAWVSGHGADAAGCGAAVTPCRTFQYAHDNVAAGGEVDVLDAANYGPVIITKALSIIYDGVGVASIQQSNAGSVAIAIEAWNTAVYLRGLTLDGLGSAANGVMVVPSGTVLTIVDCTVRHFAAYGILAGGAAKVSISSTIASDNGSAGIYLSGNNTRGVISQATANNNAADGIAFYGGVDVTIVDSVASNNKNGFTTDKQAIMRLGHSVSVGNNVGVFNGGKVYSYGDNKIDGNGTDVSAPLAPLAMR